MWLILRRPPSRMPLKVASHGARIDLVPQLPPSLSFLPISTWFDTVNLFYSFYSMSPSPSWGDIFPEQLDGDKIVEHQENYILIEK